MSEDKNVILEKVDWLNKNYGGDWFYNLETGMLEDFESDMAFLPEDV